MRKANKMKQHNYGLLTAKGKIKVWCHPIGECARDFRFEFSNSQFSEYLEAMDIPTFDVPDIWKALLTDRCNEVVSDFVNSARFEWIEQIEIENQN